MKHFRGRHSTEVTERNVEGASRYSQWQPIFLTAHSETLSTLPVERDVCVLEKAVTETLPVIIKH
jgi:hypothetical protein